MDRAVSYGDIHSKRLKDLPNSCSRGQFSGSSGFAAKRSRIGAGGGGVGLKRRHFSGPLPKWRENVAGNLGGERQSYPLLIRSTPALSCCCPPLLIWSSRILSSPPIEAVY
jgi:hypothetical protein